MGSILGLCLLAVASPQAETCAPQPCFAFEIHQHVNQWGAVDWVQLVAWDERGVVMGWRFVLKNHPWNGGPFNPNNFSPEFLPQRVGGRWIVYWWDSSGRLRALQAPVLMVSQEAVDPERDDENKWHRGIKRRGFWGGW